MAEPIMDTLHEVIIETVGYAYVEEWEDDIGLKVVRGSGMADDVLMIYYHDYEFKNRYIINRGNED